MPKNQLSQRLVFAVDLGGTHLRVALVDDSGKILQHLKQETPKGDSPDEILDLSALVDALNSRQIYAALDLHKQQPALLNTPNTILSPRRAWYTRDCFDRRVATWVGTVESYLNGSPINMVV